VNRAELFREVRRLEITTRGLVDTLMSGDYASVFRGRGMEFTEVREYLPGDDIRTIDWNVTARLGTPYVKRFREERELTLLLLVDLSASGHFGTRGRTKRELAAEVCAVLALTAARNRDRVGALLFTDQIEWFTPPRGGRSHALTIVDRVLGQDPAGAGTDLPRALGFLDPLLRRRAAVVVISDFLDQAQWAYLGRLAPRHDAIAVQLADPREAELPAMDGLVTLWEPESNVWQVADLEASDVRGRVRAAWTEHQEALERHLRAHGIDLVSLSTDRAYANDLIAFFRRRERQRG
jgi:uncharacterized protein (DUF58 family)